MLRSRGPATIKLLTRTLKYSAAEHCNLRCADCSHLSPYARPRFPSPDGLAADLAALAPVLHVRVFGLQGGEPLLNPDLPELARIARASGIADRIGVFTNGLLLHKVGDDFWQSVDQVQVSLYEDASPPASVLAEAAERAAATNTVLDIHPRPVFGAMFVTRPLSRLMTQLVFRACRITHQDECAVLSDGWFYRCGVPLGLGEYLQRLNGEAYDPAADGISIHESEDLLAELRRYLGSPRALACCRYCLGSSGTRRSHRQMTREELACPGTRPAGPVGRVNPYHLVRDLAGNARRRVRHSLRRRTG